MGFGLLERGKFYGWIALAAAALVFFLGNGVLLFSFGVFLPFICKEFGWSRGLVSGAYTMEMAVMGLCGPLAGMFIGKYGPRRAIVLGNLLGALGLLLLAFHRHVWQFYAGYGALIGLGAGLGGFLPTTTIANNWFEKRRTLALGIVMAAGGIGGLIFIPVIMVMINGIGWRSTYMVLFVIVLLLGVMVPGLFARNKPEDLGQIPDGVSASEQARTVSTRPLKKLYTTPVDFTVGEAVRTRVLWLLIGFIVTQVFVLSMLMAHQVAYLVDIGIASGMAATILGVLTGFSTIGRLGVGFLGLRYNMWPVAIGSMVMMTVGMALVLVAGSLPMVFIYAATVGIGFGAALVSSMSLFPIYFGRTDYAKIMGFTRPFIIIGSAAAPIAGAIYDTTKSYTIPFAIGVLILLLGLVCVILARPPLHPSLKGSGTKM